jgi:ubiquinone/menaquinone biosynthesis C-methylase UbiE
MSRDLKDYQYHYQNQPFEFHQVKQRRKKILEIIKDLKPKHILEVGCGYESIFIHLKNFESGTIIEPGEFFYESAIKSLKDKDKKIQFLNLTLEDSVTVLDSFEFDFIIVSALLHEIMDISSFLQCIKSISTASTIIHFNVPNVKSFHRLLAYESGLIDSVFDKSTFNIQFQQNTNFDMDLLVKTLESHDFEVIDSGSYFIKPFTHTQMQLLVDNKIINEEILEGFYAMIKYFPEMGSEIYSNVRIKK